LQWPPIVVAVSQDVKSQPLGQLATAPSVCKNR
jgi:hypothetical protein